MPDLAHFRNFVTGFTHLIESTENESQVLDSGFQLLSDLVSHDDWLPDEYAVPHAQYYQQYLLHCDPLERFSVVSFVWGPGQRTPIHDHRVWGLIGVLRGAEISTRYDRAPTGALTPTAPERLATGQVDAVSPTIGDIHSIANAYDDRASISIHVYGGNIGAIRRAVFDPATGEEKPFVSGYVDAPLPNIWRS